MLSQAQIDAMLEVDLRAPIALATASAYSGRPAAGSSPGRSTAIASCPASRSSGTTRCQYQAVPPAPGIKTKVRWPAFWSPSADPPIVLT